MLKKKFVLRFMLLNNNINLHLLLKIYCDTRLLLKLKFDLRSLLKLKVRDIGKAGVRAFCHVGPTKMTLNLTSLI